MILEEQRHNYCFNKYNWTILELSWVSGLFTS